MPALPQRRTLLRFFGSRVHILREKSGMTRRELADLAGIALKIERGDQDLRLTSSEQIAKAFNCSLRDRLPPRKSLYQDDPNLKSGKPHLTGSAPGG